MSNEIIATVSKNKMEDGFAVVEFESTSKSKSDPSICGVPGRGLPAAYFNIEGKMYFKIDHDDDGPHLLFKLSNIKAHQNGLFTGGKTAGTHNWGLFFFIGPGTARMMNEMGQLNDSGDLSFKVAGTSAKRVKWSGTGNSDPTLSGYNSHNKTKYRLHSSWCSSGMVSTGSGSAYKQNFTCSPSASSDSYLDLGIFDPYDKNKKLNKEKKIPYLKDSKGNAYAKLAVIAPIYYEGQSDHAIKLDVGVIKVYGLEMLMDYFPGAVEDRDDITKSSTWDRWDSTNRVKSSGTNEAKSTGGVFRRNYKNNTWLWEEKKNQSG